jgi:hypothetical protein
MAQITLAARAQSQLTWINWRALFASAQTCARGASRHSRQAPSGAISRIALRFIGATRARLAVRLWRTHENCRPPKARARSTHEEHPLDQLRRIIHTRQPWMRAALPCTRARAGWIRASFPCKRARIGMDHRKVPVDGCKESERRRTQIRGREQVLGAREHAPRGVSMVVPCTGARNPSSGGGISWKRAPILWTSARAAWNAQGLC